MSADSRTDPARHSCLCGGHASEAAHPAAEGGTLLDSVVEQRLWRALLPSAAPRRAFLTAVGSATAAAALDSVFPLAAAKALAAELPGAIEKRELKVGFILITCATPIIIAEPMGFYAKHRLKVEVIKTAGWAVIRDKSLNRE